MLEKTEKVTMNRQNLRPMYQGILRKFSLALPLLRFLFIRGELLHSQTHHFTDTVVQVALNQF